MKAVNQCIGRAVRHRNDYATVLLLDERYNRATIKNALPNWIKNSLRVCEYNETFKLIEQVDFIFVINSYFYSIFFSFSFLTRKH